MPKKSLSARILSTGRSLSINLTGLLFLLFPLVTLAEKETASLPKGAVLAAVVVCLTVIYLITITLSQKRTTVEMPPGLAVLIGLTAYFLLRVTILPSLLPTALFSRLVFVDWDIVFGSAFFFLYFQFVKSEEDNRSLLSYYLLGMIIPIAIGLWQYAQTFGRHLSPDEVRVAVSSTFGSTIIFAAFLGLLFPTASAFYLLARSKFESLFWFLYLTATSLLIIATASRLVWVAALVSTSLFLLLGRSKLNHPKLFLLLATIFLLLLSHSSFLKARLETTLPPKTTSSSDTYTYNSLTRRLQIWRAGTLTFLQNPLIGTGPNSFSYAVLPHRDPAMNLDPTLWSVPLLSENVYLRFLVETGLIGAALFILFPILALALAQRSLTDSPSSLLNLGVLGSFLCYLLVAFGAEMPIYPLFILAAILLRQSNFHRTIKIAKGQFFPLLAAASILIFTASFFTAQKLIVKMSVPSYFIHYKSDQPQLLTQELDEVKSVASTFPQSTEATSAYLVRIISSLHHDSPYLSGGVKGSLLADGQSLSQKIQKDFPDFPENYLLGAEYAITNRQNDPQYKDRSLSLLSHALRLDPTNPRYYNLQGISYFLSGNFAAAQENYRLALRLKPDYFSALENLGALYLITDPKQAQATLNQATQSYLLTHDRPSPTTDFLISSVGKSPPPSLQVLEPLLEF